MARIGEWKEWDVGYFEGNHLQQSKNKKDRERRVTELIPNFFIIIYDEWVETKVKVEIVINKKKGNLHKVIIKTPSVEIR